MQKEILNKNVQMDAQVAINLNGDINIYPCAWEADQAPIIQQERVSYRGRITMMDDGQTEVKRYNIGLQMPLYRKLFCTEHCDIMMSQGGMIVERWKFDKKFNFHQVWAIRQREQPAVEAFFLTMMEGLA